MEGNIKLENAEGNNLIQTYLETFNKEIEGNDGTTSVQITEIDQGDEELAGDDGTYFVDQQGRYYYQASGNTHPVITSVTADPLGAEDEITLSTDTTNQVLMNDSFQTVTIVPSEANGGEVSYVLIVQQPDEKQNDVKHDTEGALTVYDFDENEELDESHDMDSGAEDDKSKIVKIPMKKTQVVVQRHMCTYCNYTSPRRYLLSRHMKSHSEERPHKCSVCERGFKTVASLQNHVNTHTGIKPHVCKYCNSAFTTSGELVRHVRYRHTHEKPHKCSECDYASVELSKLKRHVRCHTGERPYQCPHCTYASPDTFKLKRHLRIHTGEKPYVCEYCKMCFTQSNSLKAHKLIHNIAAKPVFPCELCPTTCGRKTDLRIHVQKLHTSDKPLKCKRCGKSFPDRYSYKLHNKTHEGEKCFKCEMCPYASISQRHLASHMLIHTDEKPFACGHCDQTFRQKQLLRRHQNLYHNPNYVPAPPKEKSHECRECGRQFRHKGNLIRHLAVHDPDSAVHEKTLALKLGRQKKIHIIEGQPVEMMQGHTIGLDSDEELEPDDEDLTLEENSDGQSMMAVSSGDGQQYVVLEVIQLHGEGGEEQVAVVAPDAFIEGQLVGEDMEEEDVIESYEPQERKIITKNIKLEKDVDACFGFDDDEMEDEDEDERDEDRKDTKLTTLRLLSSN